MRTKIVGATFLMVGVGIAATVGAMDNVALQGSDTLEQVTKDVLAQCPAAVAKGITYNGGGSTTGENAMSAATPTQTVAPMSRGLNPTTGVCAKGATAEGLVIGLDGVAIMAASSEGNACGGGLAFSTAKTITVTDASGNAVINCPGCDSGTNTYHLTDWKDVLALVFAGKTHAAAATPGSTDCAGDVRRSLVNNWASLFQASCSGGTCTQLRHAFRRSDLSGTTDTFLTLVGLPSMPLAKNVPGAVAKAIAFCNAFGLGNIFGGDSDYQDKDPIRRACDANEEVCGRDGTLGLVTPVEVPADLSVAALYPSVACSPGKFLLMRPATSGITTCPNGLGLLFGKCFQPYQDLGGGAFNAHCIALRTPVQGFGANGMNGRAYNNFVKNADGSYAKDNINRFITGAYYRIHTSRVMAGGGTTCTKSSSTDQIGCLVQASPCSLGFAGREAANQAGSLALMVNGITPTQANIEHLVTTPADATDDYPLARKLYLNTLLGFGDPLVKDGELELAKCFSNNTIMNAVVSSRGFIPVPGGVLCEDFNEQSKCGAASNANACASNPAGVTPN